MVSRPFGRRDSLPMQISPGRVLHCSIMVTIDYSRCWPAWTGGQWDSTTITVDARPAKERADISPPSDKTPPQLIEYTFDFPYKPCFVMHAPSIWTPDDRCGGRQHDSNLSSRQRNGPLGGREYEGVVLMVVLATLLTTPLILALTAKAAELRQDVAHCGCKQSRRRIRFRFFVGL
jgi:hypothetical protein